jgi:histidinol-phosphate aminotransferase
MSSAYERLRPLLRPELSELSAYVPHVPVGVTVKLDANEAPPANSPAVRDAVHRAMESVPLERYPDPRALRLKAALAMRTGARESDLLVGTGSDELIALIVNAFARPRDQATHAVVLSPMPTFVMYAVTSRVHGLEPTQVPLDALWDLDVPSMHHAITQRKPNVVFLANPNNPTGNRMSIDRLEQVVAMCAEGTSPAFTIIDEAYVDYAASTNGNGKSASLRGLRTQHGHLGFLRTLSKIGLAALRIGWLEADAGLVTEIDKTRQPYNLSAMSQAVAAAVLESHEAWGEIMSEVTRVIRVRESLAAAIGALDGFFVTPSAANFLWVKTPGPAQGVVSHLLEDGILVRSFHSAGGRLASQLRITMGTEAESEQLMASLRRLPS